MGKDKLKRWAELETFNNVIQPDSSKYKTTDHPIKGHWHGEVFKNDNPIVMELGCGRGEYTIGLARRYGDRNFIGVDIKGARLWRGAKTSHEEHIQNAAFLRTRIEFIGSFFAEDEVDEIWITFPDPHLGKNNPNRRLTSPVFLSRYQKIMKDGGLVHLKTDSEELYRYTRETASINGMKIFVSTENLYSEHYADDILSIRTHYEDIFMKEGIAIKYLMFGLPKNTCIVNREYKQ